MTKEEWHKFYISNKNNFTDSLEEADKDKNKIFVSKQEYKNSSHCNNIFHSILENNGETREYYN